MQKDRHMVRLRISRGKKVSKQTSEISLQGSVTIWSSVSLMCWVVTNYDLGLCSERQVSFDPRSVAKGRLRGAGGGSGGGVADVV